MRATVCVAFSLLLAGCGFIPERISLSDPRIKPLLDAIAVVDRTSLGFTPIEADAKVTWERRPRRDYDQMLHIYGRTSRTISFRKTDSGFRWTGEQEIYRGPHTYDSVDGKYREQITVTCELEPVAMHGYPLKQLLITYHGEDPRLRKPVGLSWEEVRPILREWGYQ
jgi:hypothetical protein